MKTEDIGLPGLTGGNSAVLSNYVVKYYKADLGEPADMMELCHIETRALHSKPGSEEVVLVEKDKYTFMDKYFIILKYLEKV